MTYRAFSIVYFMLLNCVFSVSIYAEESREKKQKTLVITNSNAWKPFSYMENGQPKGLLIDFWKLYGERSGKNIVFDLVDWQDSLYKTAQGEANIHAGLVYSKTRAELFEFGSVLFNVQTSLYIDINMLNIIDTDLSHLTQPVGVIFGGYEQNFISEHYPNIPLIAYANTALMFSAIRNQEISIFVADKQVTNFYTVSFPGHLNNFIAFKQLYNEPIRYALPKGDFMLLHTVETDLKMLSQGDIEQIKQKWINTETKVPIWFYSSVFFSLLLVVAAYIYFLRKAVAKRTLQLAIVNEKLTLQANIDVLTGLYNRRFLMEYLERTQDQTHKGGFAVLMIDIDFFKLINDTYGHPVGDFVLAILAKRMQSCVREQDILARMGGEEFCVVLKGVSVEKMREISHGFNKNIAASPFKHKDEQLDITISIGALHIQHHQKWSASNALQQIDKLLYQAKDNGRDQTVCGKFT